MSDVSNFTPLLSTITADPYFNLISKAHDLVLAKYGTKIVGDASMISEALKPDGILQGTYRDVAKRYGYSKVSKFRDNIDRRINCFIAVDKNTNILGWTKEHWPCNIKGCSRCGAYRASKYLKYPDETVMIGECDNREAAHAEVTEMNQIFSALDYDYIVATHIPTHDGRNIILIGCLRYQELNPLTEDNEVKAAIDFVEHEYKYLERVDAVQTSHKYENTFVTRNSNIIFNTTKLYESMPEGQDTARERGKMAGYYFDYDKMEVAYMAKNDEQKKTNEDNGVIYLFNTPVSRSDVPDEVKKIAIKRTLKTASYHHERAAFPVDTVEDVAYHVNRFNLKLIGEYEDLGYPQPEIQATVRLTQEKVDDFKRFIGVPDNGDIPENIMNMKFEDLDRKVYGIRDRVSLLRQNRLYETQQSLESNLTIDEVTDIIMKQIKAKPPG